jgi:hypothetical protein
MLNPFKKVVIFIKKDYMETGMKQPDAATFLRQ